MLPRWLSNVLNRVHELAEEGKIRLTAKALAELSSLGLGLDAEDARDVLCALKASDFTERIRSATTNEWMYVWKPDVFEIVLYIKLIVRGDCVIVSFHEDEGDQYEEAP